MRAAFKYDVRYVMKGTSIVTVHLVVSLTNLSGSRDPASLHGDGAGFVLVWQGNPKILVGLPNPDNEVIQVVSNSMFMAIPK